MEPTRAMFRAARRICAAASWSPPAARRLLVREAEAMLAARARYAPPMPGPRHDSIGHPYIHHAIRVDGQTPTTCGLVRAPSSTKWAVVSCPECLAIGARSDDAARARLRVIEARGKRE